MFSFPLNSIRRILCLGAHSDDVEIGCGATLLRLLREQPGIHVEWVVFSGDAERAQEARTSAEAFLADAGSRNVTVLGFRDSYFPSEIAPIKDAMREVRGEVDPDLVLTHRLDDRHQDHRVVAELTWNAWRNHLILEYEIPKYEGDLAPPNFFVRCTPDDARRKVELIRACFASQREKAFLHPELLQGMLRLRGMEAAAPSGLAEAFHCRKLVV